MLEVEQTAVSVAVWPEVAKTSLKPKIYLVRRQYLQTKRWLLLSVNRKSCAQLPVVCRGRR